MHCRKRYGLLPTIDGVQVNAGIYIYYSYAPYMELTQTLQSENSELDVSDKDVVKEQKMDGVSSEEWIKNKALEYCQRYVAIEKKFEELDLSLTEEENKEISSTIDSFWDTNGELYEKNGIAKSSVQSVLENTYMTNDVFLYYYGLDGEEGTTEDDLKQYYEENNARVRYIKFNLTDGNGEALDDAGKNDMKAKVRWTTWAEINALKGDEDAMEDEMDTVQSRLQCLRDFDFRRGCCCNCNIGNRCRRQRDSCNNRRDNYDHRRNHNYNYRCRRGQRSSDGNCRRQRF